MNLYRIEEQKMLLLHYSETVSFLSIFLPTPITHATMHAKMKRMSTTAVSHTDPHHLSKK